MAAISVLFQPAKCAWETFFRLIRSRNRTPQMLRLSAITLVTLATLIYMFAVIRYPIYLTTNTGSLRENSPPCGFGVTFSSRINDSAAPPCLCPLYPHTLRGVSWIDLKGRAGQLSPLAELNHDVRAGGRWMPPRCRSRQHLAVIIPFRDRGLHLRILLSHLHPFLQRQMRRYQIFVVEQAYDETFNKGMIMNLAFTEVMRRGRWDCVVFHDVDMIPQNDRNIYECMRQPRHLSPGLDEMRFTLQYWDLVGGALALTPEQVVKTNGYSNVYWGWGGEDDDMFLRIESAGYELTRPANHIGRYKMVKHKKRTRAESRYELLDSWHRWKSDGLSSLHKYNATVLGVTELALYTNITVDVGKPPSSLLQEAFVLASAKPEKRTTA